MLMNRLVSLLLSWSNFKKRSLIIIIDSLIITLSVWIALSVNTEGIFLPNKENLYFFLSFLIIALPIFTYFDLYRSVIRYIGFKEIWSITGAITFSILLVYLINFMIRTEFSSLSVFFSIWTLLLLLIISSRLFASWLLMEKSLSSNVIIYGAGAAGVQLASALRFSRELKPVCFIDEDKSIQGNFVNGIRVFSPSKLASLARKKNVQEILVAIPSAKKYVLNRIISDISDLPVKVRVLPGVTELAQGKISVSDLKILDITDLLGRDATVPHKTLLEKNIKLKSVMVTGAGGSIGSELCRQIIKIGPKRLILFELSEPSLYAIEKELMVMSKEVEIFPILGNVIDKEDLIKVCNTFRVETIYHAAAYKQVPMVEKNTIQSFKNNALGTYNAAKISISCGVETFVLISTDKAVRPTNVMGATKRFSELILQSLAKQQENAPSKMKTKFSIVRFGNVLGSSSSVVPLFREQIKKGGPVTVTDHEIVRYFMSIPEAAELVIQAGSLGEGGEVFVLDMGKPIKILDLAKKMIRLSGYEVLDKNTKEGDIEITFTGLREGEKLYEELIIGDSVSKTEHDRILKAEEESLSIQEIEKFLKDFKIAIEKGDELKVHELLIQSISGFEPYSGLNDLIYLSKKNKNSF